MLGLIVSHDFEMKNKFTKYLCEEVSDIMKIIDSSLRFRTHEMEAEIPALLDTMEKTGISHAVISPSDEYIAVYNSEGNKIIEKIVRRFPNSFTGLAVVNPWYGDKGCDTLRSAFEENLSGLYLHPGSPA